MESFDTFSDDALASLFGLEVSLSLHQYRLKAASTFLRLRQRLEINAVKLQTLELRDFHKSTKKALFRNSMKNAADEKIESHILLPLIKDGASLRKQSLERLILVCYALQPADYKAIVDSGLKNVFTRLMRGIVIHISIRQDILDVLSAIIRDVWTGKDNSASILDVLQDNGQSHDSYSQLPNPLPVSTKTFAYEMASVEALEVLLGTSCLLDAVRQSSRWLEERSSDNDESRRFTRCLSAFAPSDMSKDTELRLTIPWFSGWDIINNLQFQSLNETDIVLE